MKCGCDGSPEASVGELVCVVEKILIGQDKFTHCSSTSVTHTHTGTHTTRFFFLLLLIFFKCLQPKKKKKSLSSHLTAPTEIEPKLANGLESFNIKRAVDVYEEPTYFSFMVFILSL